MARLGLAWARQKEVRDHDALSTVLRITRAGVASVRAEGAAWCVSLLETLSFSTADNLRDLCDAPFIEARGIAVDCLGRVDRFRTDVRLWFALTESPYHDVRDFAVRRARDWVEQAEPGTLARFWSTALLSVHTGSTAKPRVLRNIVDRVAQHPDEVESLLPILGLLLRSVRPAERGSSLAALTRAVLNNEAVRAAASRHLPDLVISGDVAS